MSRLEAALRAIVGDLSVFGVPCALVGGLAVSARTEPRFTRDIDLAVAAGTDREAETIVNRLLGRGYSVLASLEQTAVNRLATVRLRAAGEPPEGVVVDLLFASSGIEREIVAQADALEVAAGLVIPVARLGHLLALKLLARDEDRRPQDDQDLAGLMAVASDSDIAELRAAIGLIGSRGFHRDKDLGAELTALMTRFRRTPVRSES